MDLTQSIKAKIEHLGVKEASLFFGVSLGTVSNWGSGKASPSIAAAQKLLNELPEPDRTPVNHDLFLWEGRKVAILLPVYRTINPDTHFTLFANYVGYGPTKIAIPKPVKGTCIWEARNMLVEAAMKMPEVERFIFVDDDMILPHGHSGSFNEFYGAGVSNESASFNAISRIVSSGPEKGIVGALYFGRHAHGKSQCYLGFTDPNGNEGLRSGRYNGLMKMPWVGTGMMKIERWAIEKIRKGIDDGKFPDCKPWSKDGWYGYFNPVKVGTGEDISFCLRAGDCGVDVYLDASLVCLHAGDAFYGPKNTKA